METTTLKVNHLLKKRGVWITTPRLKVMEFFLRNSEKLLSQEDIIAALVKKKLNRITIYRTLAHFCETGLIYKIQDARKKSFYSLENNIYLTDQSFNNRFSEHYHFNCIKCESFIRLPESSVNTTLPTGHIKTSTNLLVLGYCNNCSKGKKIKPFGS